MLNHSPFGLAKSWETIENYSHIFSKYNTGYNFENKTILEVGSGKHIFTGLFFISHGAKKVLLVDPNIRISDEIIASSVKKWNAFCLRSKSELPISETHLMDSLFTFADMNDIPHEYNLSIHNSFSHFALEHFPDLYTFYHHTSRLLTNNGVSDNIVDLGDHTYHIVYKYNTLRRFSVGKDLYHLRYSDKTFDTINDRKCYMNRMLLPVYIDMATQYNLEPEIVSKSMFMKTEIHDDVLSRFQSRNPDDIYITSFRILLKKTKPIPDCGTQAT